MRIDLQWTGVPDTGDPIDQRTWARLELEAAGAVLTRVRDRRGGSERDGIYVPLYALARWFVTNWWSLLYEPWPFRTDLPTPGAEISPEEQAWIQRHCLRAASSGFASPHTCLFGQGPRVALVSRPDPYDRYHHTPVDFLANADADLDREELRNDLAVFIDTVLRRLDSFADERVDTLSADWTAICSAGAEEAEFCRAAGRLGLDPYDVGDWPPGLVEWLEGASPGELDTAFLVDLLEAPDVLADKPGHHAALSRIQKDLQLTSAGRRYGPERDAEQRRLLYSSSAHASGYSLATWVRQRLHLENGVRLETMQDAADAACNHPLVVREDQPLPDGRISALVGWQDHGDPIIAPHAHARVGSPSYRFLCARGLHLALQGTMEGPRLVTDARTWDQRASRAFAAELLAPRSGVDALISAIERSVGTDEATIRVAEHYQVSPMVIQHQLENLRCRFIDR